jgi:hypothetical protein
MENTHLPIGEAKDATLKLRLARSLTAELPAKTPKVKGGASEAVRRQNTAKVRPERREWLPRLKIELNLINPYRDGWWLGVRWRGEKS